MKISRRKLIKGLGVGVVLSHTSPFMWSTEIADQQSLIAEVQKTHWFSEGVMTQVWGYDKAVLRLQQFKPVSIQFKNTLAEPTSVHWHGMRVPNAMDGVSGMTQTPVLPGETFEYAFIPKDAGTYWAHAHHETYRQLSLGLYMPIIVEESQPYPVDRDLLFVADDWLVGRNEQLDVGSFNNTHAWSHGGRMGNFLTINRERLPEIKVKANERIRLRVMNTANSRIMTFAFPGVVVAIIAKDGQPLDAVKKLNGSLKIAPAERYDLVIDIPSDWSGTYPIYEQSDRKPFLTANWNVESKKDFVELNEVSILPRNPIPNPNFEIQHKLALNMRGGAMGNLGSGYYNGVKKSARELRAEKQFWTFNGVANLPNQPLIKVKVGDGVEIKFVNETRWPHAMHLHGQHFYAKNEIVGSDIWQDTTLVNSRDTQTIKFIADSPGKWLLHCHMIEHQISGMVTYIEVEA